MRCDAGTVPEWPTETHRATRDEAIAAALDVMEPGDVCWAHQDDCALRVDEACDCAVALVPYPTVVQ